MTGKSDEEKKRRDKPSDFKDIINESGGVCRMDLYTTGDYDNLLNSMDDDDESYISAMKINVILNAINEHVDTDSPCYCYKCLSDIKLSTNFVIGLISPIGDSPMNHQAFLVCDACQKGGKARVRADMLSYLKEHAPFLRIVNPTHTMTGHA